MSYTPVETSMGSQITTAGSSTPWTAIPADRSKAGPIVLIRNNSGVVGGGNVVVVEGRWRGQKGDGTAGSEVRELAEIRTVTSQSTHIVALADVRTLGGRMPDDVRIRIATLATSVQLTGKIFTVAD